MNYVLLHKKIRNDEHCPTCRKYYISLHEDKQKAYVAASEDIEDDDLKILKRDDYVWVDEWVRRRNGDLYQVIPLELDRIYELGEPISVMKESDMSNEHARFMLLHIVVDKTQWCPENIRFMISFYSSKDKNIQVDLDDSRMNNLLDLKPVLRKLKEYHWWSDSDTETSEDLALNDAKWEYYQMIPIEPAEEIYLNGYCELLKSGTW